MLDSLSIISVEYLLCKYMSRLECCCCHCIVTVAWIPARRKLCGFCLEKQFITCWWETVLSLSGVGRKRTTLIRLCSLNRSEQGESFLYHRSDAFVYRRILDACATSWFVENECCVKRKNIPFVNLMQSWQYFLFANCGSQQVCDRSLHESIFIYVTEPHRENTSRRQTGDSVWMCLLPGRTNTIKASRGPCVQKFVFNIT